MSASVIGLWAARFRDEEQRTRWHRIESEIEDRYVTHCGRQMRRRMVGGHLLTEADPAGKCGRCAVALVDSADGG